MGQDVPSHTLKDAFPHRDTSSHLWYIPRQVLGTCNGGSAGRWPQDKLPAWLSAPRSREGPTALPPREHRGTVGCEAEQQSCSSRLLFSHDHRAWMSPEPPTRCSGFLSQSGAGCYRLQRRACPGRGLAALCAGISCHQVPLPKHSHHTGATEPTLYRSHGGQLQNWACWELLAGAAPRPPASCTPPWSSAKVY